MTNLYQQVLDFMNKKSDDTSFNGYYSLGELKENNWQVIISVNGEIDNDGRDVTVTPMLLVPKYEKGRKTSEIKAKLELNSNFEYIFWQAKDRDKDMFEKVQYKLALEPKQIDKAKFIEKQGNNNQLFDSIRFYLNNWCDILGYDFNSIISELKNDFGIETNF